MGTKSRPELPSRPSHLVRRPFKEGPIAVNDGDIAVFRGPGGLVIGSGGALGKTVIASGSLGTGASKALTDIPQNFAALYLSLAGVSCDTATRHLQVQLSSNNGSSYDATAGNYVGFTVAATTLAALSEATLIQSADVAAANVHTVGLLIQGYNVGAPVLAKGYLSNGTTKYLVDSVYVNTVAINALKVLWNGAGNFDAGTFSLVGLR